MRPSDFTDKAPGRLVETVKRDGMAFVPDKLPPDIPYSESLVSKLSEADVALANLNASARTLPNPEILVRPFLVREAVDSSKIEGTQTTYSGLFLFEAATPSARQAADPDVRVVGNYLSALRYGIGRAVNLPVSRRLICEVHTKLMAGYNEARTRPGQIRSDQVLIGSRNATPTSARFVPPPHTFLNDLISDFERFANARAVRPLLVTCALLHYQFEAIHPFWDGNGRVGRLLISLTLCAEGRLFSPILYLSSYFERHRREYYDALLRVSTHGDWQSWLEFFLEGVRTQAQDATDRILKLQLLREEYRGRLSQRPRGTVSNMRLIDMLFETTFASVPMVRKRLNLSAPSGKECIMRLEQAGILIKYQRIGNTHFWVAQEIIDVINR